MFIATCVVVGHSTRASAGEEPGDAHAAPTGHVAEGYAEQEPKILTGDLGNVFWTATIFIALLIVLRATAWKPILSALQQREKFITESLESAKRDRVEAQRVLAEYSKKVDQARSEASVIVDEGRRDAEEVRKRIHVEAKSEADAIIARAKKDIEMARDDAVKQLHDHAVVLASNMASKIVRKELTAGDHSRLLEESLAELGKVNN